MQLFWFSLIVTEALKMAGYDVPALNPGFD
jgi:hypothetical protein